MKKHGCFDPALKSLTCLGRITRYVNAINLFGCVAEKTEVIFLP